MVLVLAATGFNVQSNTRSFYKSVQKFPGVAEFKMSFVPGQTGQLQKKIGPAGNIHGGLHQRLIHRNGDETKTSDALFIG